jgi:cytochrome b6-f complex iron-sulfur subunit
MNDVKANETLKKRRGFVNTLLGVAVTGWVGSLLYPVIRYLRPANDASGGPLKLSAEQLAKVEKEHFVIARSGPHRVIVFQAGGELRALSARCTHEGCTVQFVPGDSVIWCACHNGKFDLDGRVLSGPPPRPLARWALNKEGEQILLTQEKA